MRCFESRGNDDECRRQLERHIRCVTLVEGCERQQQQYACIFFRALLTKFFVPFFGLLSNILQHLYKKRRQGTNSLKKGISHGILPSNAGASVNMKKCMNSQNFSLFFSSFFRSHGIHVTYKSFPTLAKITNDILPSIYLSFSCILSTLVFEQKSLLCERLQLISMHGIRLCGPQTILICRIFMWTVFLYELLSFT